MTASDVAKYFLLRASEDGDLITNLKMQKLIYYAYVFSLVGTGKKLFDEPIEAWPNGPVVASLYHELKEFGSMPIDEDYIGDPEKIMKIIEESGFRKTLDDVYERFIPKSAFELVTLTHAEKPWLNARDGRGVTESSNEPIKDEDIISYYNR